jgi:hypothetical protein
MPSAAVELSLIIQRVYQQGDDYSTIYYHYDGRGGYGGGSYNIPENGGGYGGGNYGSGGPRTYHPNNVFGERVLYNYDSKTLREIQELIFMLSHEGKLPARMQRMETQNAKLKEKLQKPISVSCEASTFETFLDLLVEELEIAIFVDKQAFEDEDMSNPLDGEISLDVTDLPALSVLELALCQIDETGYRLNNGILEILPSTMLENPTTLRVYPVADLLTADGNELFHIHNLITTLCVLFKLSDNQYGTYSPDRDEERFFMPFQKKLLVAWLPQQQHEQLKALLHAMRHDGQYPAALQARLDANQELYAKLQAEISFECQEMFFPEMIQSLHKQTGLTFFVDETALVCENMEHAFDNLITLRMQNQSIETVLDYAMRQMGEDVDFIAWNGVVYIAPRVVCEYKTEPFFFVYPIQRLAKQEPERFLPPSKSEAPPPVDVVPDSDDGGFTF